MAFVHPNATPPYTRTQGESSILMFISLSIETPLYNNWLLAGFRLTAN
jgi:hypothetical protein